MPVETKGHDMPPKQEKFDLYTFVAGAALQAGKPFQLECNCSGIVTIMPPFQDEYVVCPRCESRIKMIVIEGDPGYIIGADPDGTPKLLPVVASGGAERRPPLQKEVVAGRRTGTTGGIQVSPVGQPATGRSAGVAGATEPDDRQADAGDRLGSGEVSRGATP
ncbi:MAG: hypothetical protein WCD15_21635, partial [Terriglobales bacterium]